MTYDDGLIVVRDGRIEAVGDAATLLPTLGPDTPVDHYPGSIVSPGFSVCSVKQKHWTLSNQPAVRSGVTL